MEDNFKKNWFLKLMWLFTVLDQLTFKSFSSIIFQTVKTGYPKLKILTKLSVVCYLCFQLYGPV